MNVERIITHGVWSSFLKDIKKRLEELDRQTVAIDDHVQRLSTVTPIKDDEVPSHLTHTHLHTLSLTQTEVDSDDLTIHCATCSQPVTLKKAMTHFEKCFSRVTSACQLVAVY